MKTALLIINELQNQPDCLFIASEIYNNHFRNLISETAYYQTLTRMCKHNTLVRLTKGIYYIPSKTRFGTITPSDKDIINYFTADGNGVVLGYYMYNSIGITTHISETIHILSSRIQEKRRTINNTIIEKLNINYTEQRQSVLYILDILYHFKSIEDINYNAFYLFCRQFAYYYNDFETKYIIEKTNYPKWTIAFLAEVLNYFNTKNSLSHYLSSLSKYNIPNVEKTFNSVIK